MKRTWTGTINSEKVIITVEQDDIENIQSPRNEDNIGTMICFSNSYNWGDEHQYRNPRHFLEDLASRCLDNQEAKAIVEKALQKNVSYELAQDSDGDYYWETVLDLKIFKDDTCKNKKNDEEQLEEEQKKWASDVFKELSYKELKDIVHTQFVLLPIFVYKHCGVRMTTTPFSYSLYSGQIGYIYASKQHFLDEAGYTEDELFSSDTKRTPYVGNIVRIKKQTTHADKAYVPETFGIVANIKDGMAMIDFNANYDLSERGPENYVTVPLSEIDEVLSNLAEKKLMAEVDIYDSYLNKEVYQFKIERVVACDSCKHETYEEIDSCGGFYGRNPLTNGMVEQMESKYRVLFNKSTV